MNDMGYKGEGQPVKSPAFQFYPKDFLADESVDLMDNRQTGCYIRLLCKCWIEGSIPADITKIAKLCREDPSIMAELWTAIRSRFVELPDQPDRLVNPRLAEERKKQEEYQTERASSGAKGAKARWDKRSTQSATDSSPDGSANGSAIEQPIAKNASSSSSSSVLDPDNEEEAGQTKLAKMQRLRLWLHANCEKSMHAALTGSRWEQFIASGFEVETIQLAIQQATDQGAGDKPIYVYRILQDWEKAQAFTKAAAQALIAAHEHKKGIPKPEAGPRKPFLTPHVQPTLTNNADLYDEIERNKSGGVT